MARQRAELAKWKTERAEESQRTVSKSPPALHSVVELHHRSTLTRTLILLILPPRSLLRNLPIHTNVQRCQRPGVRVGRIGGKANGTGLVMFLSFTFNRVSPVEQGNKKAMGCASGMLFSPMVEHRAPDRSFRCC